MNQSSYLDYLEPFLAEPDIHDTRKLGILRSEMVMPLSICAGLGVFDCVLIGAADAGLMPLAISLLAHISATGVALVLAGAKRLLGLETLFSRLAIMLAVTMGPFGATAGAVALFTSMYLRNTSFSFREWFDFIYPRAKVSIGESVYEDIAVGVDEHVRPYDVVPYMDIMRLGSDFQKRAALTQMIMNFHPKFSPALVAAMQDESHIVRTIVAIGIVRIRNQIADKEEKLAAASVRNAHNPDYQLASARFYDDIAGSGLLDVRKRDEYLSKAGDMYRRYLLRDQGNLKVTGWVGRMLVRSGQAPAAIRWLKPVVDTGCTDPIVLSWYAEALFMDGRYAELRRLMYSDGHNITKSTDSAIYDAVAMWRSGMKEAAIW